QRAASRLGGRVMGDRRRCSGCGENYDPSGTPHLCPGPDKDRIEALEERVEELEGDLEDLNEIVATLQSQVERLVREAM
ncbi:MAG: hypothetical protein ACYDH4_11440, partial [Candidatus Cryosericum sp.]